MLKVIGKQILKMNAKDVIEWLLDASRKQDNVDVNELAANYIEHLQSVDLFKLSGVSNSIFIEPQVHNHDGDPYEAYCHLLFPCVLIVVIFFRMLNVFKLKMEPQDFSMKLMNPYVIRPPPPLLEPSKDEVFLPITDR